MIQLLLSLFEELLGKSHLMTPSSIAFSTSRPGWPPLPAEESGISSTLMTQCCLKKNDEGETPAVSAMLSRGINERIPSDNSHQLSAPCLTCSDCHQPNTLPSVFSEDPLVRQPMRLSLFRVLGPPATAHLNLTQAS